MCSLLLNSIEDKTVCRHTVCSREHLKKENATKNTSEWVHVARSWEKQATGSSKPRPEIIKNIHPQLALQLHTEKPLYLHTAVNWCGFLCTDFLQFQLLRNPFLSALTSGQTVSDMSPFVPVFAPYNVSFVPGIVSTWSFIHWSNKLIEFGSVSCVYRGVGGRGGHSFLFPGWTKRQVNLITTVMHVFIALM